MGKNKDKPQYAPMPLRAFGDERLQKGGLHFRVLGVIAAHDRLGANGIGCYASHKRLTALVDCAYTRLSTTIKDLAEWGYLKAQPHPLNKRLRVYQVIYNEHDAAFLKQQIVDPQGNDESAIVHMDFEEVADSNEGNIVNIFCEAENTSCETENISHEMASASQTHQPTSKKNDIQRQASIFDRQAKQHPNNRVALTQIQEALDLLLEEAEVTNDMSVIGHVNRVQEDVFALLDEF